ncbi:NAD-binding protein [Streptomyces sp. NPDC092370]|uniref:NAD-binding protein n=1 Tax=Streptomyces sp. NPDC092370 TaxID=3366016 RepID=UPI0037F8ABDF
MGLGRFGSSLAGELMRRGWDVLGIDTDARLVQKYSDGLPSPSGQRPGQGPLPKEAIPHTARDSLFGFAGPSAFAVTVVEALRPLRPPAPRRLPRGSRVGPLEAVLGRLTAVAPFTSRWTGPGS